MMPSLWRSASTSEIVRLLIRSGDGTGHVAYASGSIDYVDLRSNTTLAHWQAREALDGTRFRPRAHAIGDRIVAYDARFLYSWSRDGREVQKKALGPPIQFLFPTSEESFVLGSQPGIIDQLSADLRPLRQIAVATSRVVQVLPLGEREILVAHVDRISRVVDDCIVGEIWMPPRTPPLRKYPRLGLARIVQHGSAVIAQTVSGKLFRVVWEHAPHLMELGEGVLVDVVAGELLIWSSEGLATWTCRDGAPHLLSRCASLEGGGEANSAFAGLVPGEILVVGADRIWRRRGRSMELAFQTIREITAECAKPGGGVYFSVGRDVCLLE